MLRTNKEKLVTVSVMGQVAHPLMGSRPQRVGFDGRVACVPGVGGITYDRRVGDPCVGLLGDHIEPAVSTHNTDKSDLYGPGFNRAYNALSCVGNEAIVASGDAKGEKGVVTGKHGGIEHVIIDFTTEVMERMFHGDKILVKSRGQGLALLDYPDIALRSIAPELLEKLPIVEKDGALEIGVARIVPGRVMGSGLGADQVYTGDYDIQLFDEAINEEYGLDDLRFGDIVAIMDTDHTHGRIFKDGAVSIGIIVHSESAVAGHGPGVTSLMTTREAGLIVPHLDDASNIATLMDLR